LHYIGEQTIGGIYEEVQLRKLRSFLYKQETEEITSQEMVKEDLSPTFVTQLIITTGVEERGTIFVTGDITRLTNWTMGGST